MRIQRIQALDEQVTAAESQIRSSCSARRPHPEPGRSRQGFAKQEVTVSPKSPTPGPARGAVQGGNPGNGRGQSGAQRATRPAAALVENYPELKSNQNFLQLQDQLEGTENRISVARQDYNNAARQFNTFIRTFPYNLTAKMFGHGTPRDYFELSDETAGEVPKVQF
jgi:LemA protein